jgi:hypothetical protein
MMEALMSKFLGKFSIGMGDRFGREADSQLAAVIAAKNCGVDVTPVWNKSNREHTLIGSRPEDVREAAARAVKSAGWTGAWFTDADHVNLGTFGKFAASCDFFTLDVADKVGKPASDSETASCLASLAGVPGVSHETARASASKYLAAVLEAGRVYKNLSAAKQVEKFVVEVSMDETDRPQTPEEFLCILKMIADEKIPADTIAPRFCGRFNKGIDFRGDLVQFESEFDALVAALVRAKKEFGLKSGLKLSVHSGSDKWSVYPVISRIIRKYGEGLHLKTAGTTWLEELAGLAESGSEGLALCKKIYRLSLPRFDELCGPYKDVLEIVPARIPLVALVDGWSAEEFCRALRNDPFDERFNPDFRQFLHVSFRVAAEQGGEFTDLLEKHHGLIGERVKYNLLKRHIMPLFGSGERKAEN